MAIFNSYVSLPEGMRSCSEAEVVRNSSKSSFDYCLRCPLRRSEIHLPGFPSKKITLSLRIHGAGIFTYIGIILNYLLGVNVGKYSIHGSSGSGTD